MKKIIVSGTMVSIGIDGDIQEIQVVLREEFRER